MQQENCMNFFFPEENQFRIVISFVFRPDYAKNLRADDDDDDEEEEYQRQRDKEQIKSSSGKSILGEYRIDIVSF